MFTNSQNILSVVNANQEKMQSNVTECNGDYLS